MSLVCNDASICTKTCSVSIYRSLLLYRFKHFTPARDYCVRGVKFHAVMPQCLSALEHRLTFILDTEIEVPAPRETVSME